MKTILTKPGLVEQKLHLKHLTSNSNFIVWFMIGKIVIYYRYMNNSIALIKLPSPIVRTSCVGVSNISICKKMSILSKRLSTCKSSACSFIVVGKSDIARRSQRAYQCCFSFTTIRRVSSYRLRFAAELNNNNPHALGKTRFK